MQQATRNTVVDVAASVARRVNRSVGRFFPKFLAAGLSKDPNVRGALPRERVLNKTSHAVCSRVTDNARECNEDT